MLINITKSDARKSSRYYTDCHRCLLATACVRIFKQPFGCVWVSPDDVTIYHRDENRTEFFRLGKHSNKRLIKAMCMGKHKTSEFKPFVVRLIPHKPVALDHP